MASVWNKNLVAEVSIEWRALNSLVVGVGAVLILSGLATGASWLCYFRALNLGEASRVAAVVKLSVVVVAVFGVPLLRERLGATGRLGIALVMTGLICLVKRSCRLLNCNRWLSSTYPIRGSLLSPHSVCAKVM